MGKKLGSIMLILVTIVLLVVGVFSVFKLFKTSDDDVVLNKENTFGELTDVSTENEVEQDDYQEITQNISEEDMEADIIEETSEESEMVKGLMEDTEWRELDKESKEDIMESQNYIDEDKYYAENSDVVEEVLVKDSTNVMNEKEVLEFLSGRGFNIDEFMVTTDFDMDGNYLMDYEMSAMSTEKHPIYTMQLAIDGQYYWVINVVDGDIIANPFFYNLQSGKVQLMFSESDTMTSYGCETNKFYKNVPNKDVMDLKVVDQIDYDTLKSLTYDLMDNY